MKPYVKPILLRRGQLAANTATLENGIGLLSPPVNPI